MAIRQTDFTPIELIADTTERLPGQVGVARAYIGVKGQEPAVVQCEPAFHAKDPVPEIDGFGQLTVALLQIATCQRELGVERQQAGAGEQIEARLLVAPYGLGSTQGPDPVRKLQVRIQQGACRAVRYAHRFRLVTGEIRVVASR